MHPITSNIADTLENRTALSREQPSIMKFSKDEISKKIKAELKAYTSLVFRALQLPDNGDSFLEKKADIIDLNASQLFEKRCHIIAETYTLQELQDIIHFEKSEEGISIASKRPIINQKFKEIFQTNFAGLTSQYITINLKQCDHNQPSPPSLARKYTEMMIPIESIITQLVDFAQLSKRLIEAINPLSSNSINLYELKFKAKHYAPIMFEEYCKVIENDYTTPELESLISFYNDPNHKFMLGKLSVISSKFTEIYGEVLINLLKVIFE